ncbi:hypothetical protein ACWEOA_30095 [Streptomyces sp. NPDC004457]|uniref:hypothetical protein n=1 Tax=Streptomyces spinosus TaxID=2872623 RepID=UPI001CED2C61|nr:hypothetical protein [Streptomyces spinosus]
MDPVLAGDLARLPELLQAARDLAVREVAGLAVRPVAASGEAYVTPTVYGDVPGLRAAFSNWRTTEADTDRVLAVLAAASGRGS